MTVSRYAIHVRPVEKDPPKLLTREELAQLVTDQRTFDLSFVVAGQPVLTLNGAKVTVCQPGFQELIEMVGKANRAERLEAVAAAARIAVDRADHPFPNSLTLEDRLRDLELYDADLEQPAGG